MRLQSWTKSLLLTSISRLCSIEWTDTLFLSVTRSFDRLHTHTHTRTHTPLHCHFTTITHQLTVRLLQSICQDFQVLCQLVLRFKLLAQQHKVPRGVLRMPVDDRHGETGRQRKGVGKRERKRAKHVMKEESKSRARAREKGETRRKS